MPLVSVVCPFFNEEAIIERAIEGMARNLETLGRPWELILVNDGSADESPELSKNNAQPFRRHSSINKQRRQWS